MMAKAKPAPEVVTPAVVERSAESVWKNTGVVNATIALFVTIVVTAGTLGSAYIQLENNRLQTQSKLAIDKVAEETKKASSIAQESAEEAKKSNDKAVAQISNIKESTDETRAMGNHQTQILLELYAESAREVADYTKDPVKVSIAERAEKRLADHIEAQEQFNKSKKVE